MKKSLKLVYKSTQEPVRVGDICSLANITEVVVKSFCTPRKLSSKGIVTVVEFGIFISRYNVSMIGAQWIEKEDEG